MKKVLLSICTFLSINTFSQCDLTGINADLTFQYRHWKWAVSKIGDGIDSTGRARIRAFRAQVVAANPPTDVSNLTINNVPGEVIVFVYRQYIFNNSFAEYFNMGSTDAERRTIFTSIRGLSDPCIIARVAAVDAQALNFYASLLNIGKSIIKDE